MRPQQLMALAGGLLAATVSIGWTHGGLRSVLEFASWEKVAADAPCNAFEKDGHDVKVAGPLIVDGKTFEHHKITDEKLVKEIDDRCPLRRG
jgi:hypothetical protein